MISIPRAPMKSATLTPIALTDSSADEQLPYFTTDCMTDGGGILALISTRFEEGGFNVARLERSTGRIEPLTRLRDRYLCCYPYFDGGDVGLNKSSLALHSASGSLYFVVGLAGGTGQVCRVSLHTGKMEVLAELPSDVTVGYTHVSSDNRRLLLPLADSRILSVGRKRSHNSEISRFYRDNALITRMAEVDTQSGVIRTLWEEPDWVTHVQYHPRDYDRILFNHEWRWPLGTTRLWLRDGIGAGPRRLRDAGWSVGNGHLSASGDNVAHEVWQQSGERFIYHGYTGDGVAFVGSGDPDGGDLREILFPPSLKGCYGHFIPDANGDRIVTDSFSSNGRCDDPRARYISLLRVDWERGDLQCQHLCLAGSSWKTQDEHPHPVFSSDGAEILFTSDMRGRRAVYALPATVQEDG